MLGMTMDPETGKFRIDKGFSSLDPPIESADIVVVDECSMVNEEALHHIMSKKPYRCKVIFSGDIGQLPPIREDQTYYRDHPSPTFQTSQRAVLLERVRQGEESPILPYADYFWNNSQDPYPVASPVPASARNSIVSRSGSLVFSKSGNAIDAVLPLFKEAVETGNPDIVRIVVYKNNTRRVINNKIRDYLFGEESEKQFLPGELIVFSDNWGFGPDKISNSTEVQVKHVSEITTEDGWKTFELGTSINGRPRQLPVLCATEVERFTYELNRLAEKAKALPFGPARSDAWKNFYGLKERFAPVEYAYSITSHKAQGSTYDVSVVAEADINSVQAASSKSKSQSIYTSITRARHLVIIMDGITDHHSELLRAMDVLKEQRGQLPFRERKTPDNQDQTQPVCESGGIA
jgi:exodeoxyribonuclease-5